MAPLGRYVVIFGGFAAAVGLTLYPIFFYPMSHLGDYKKTQSINRAGIIQEDVQPPGISLNY
uniref:Small integral membrane protein 20 n=1 Tax=Pseudonaja textilis TaxID=8673 RepID=A0A670YAL1_PSETE